jgi:hypothetical protein
MPIGRPSLGSEVEQVPQRFEGADVTGFLPGRGSIPDAPAAGFLRVCLLWQTANVSSDNPPDLHMLNVVVRDMAASLDFYWRLGIAGPASGDPAGAHVQLKMPGGFSLELDTAESARLWHAGWRADPESVKVILGFVLPNRQAVDDRYAELTRRATGGGSRRSTRSGAPGTRSWPIPTATTSA